MRKCGRSCIAASMACAILLLIAAPAYPSYDTEAGRKYTIARQRLADLKKSEKKKMYRSYWLDCVRTFEQVEKTYPEVQQNMVAVRERGGKDLGAMLLDEFIRLTTELIRARSTTTELKE